MTSDSIFITGGAGFIGSRLAATLAKEAPQRPIWIYDNLHPQVHGQNAVPPALPNNVHFIRGDIGDREAIMAALTEAKPKTVYHLAAETGTGQSYDEPVRYCMANIIGTANLIEAIRAVGTVTNVILAASRAAYGEGGYRDSRGHEFAGLPRLPAAMQQGDFSVPLPAAAQLPAEPIASHGGLPAAPASVYASTKLMQEYLLAQAGDNSPWRATFLRFQNVYGPGQTLRNPYTGALSIFARQLLEGKTLDIYEDGEIMRDFVFVDDVVAALILAGGERAGDTPHGTIIDIGSGAPVSILEAAQILMQALGRDEDSYRITGNFRVGDIRHACADLTKANSLLGWVPNVAIAAGLTRLAEWAKLEFAAGKL